MSGDGPAGTGWRGPLWLPAAVAVFLAFAVVDPVVGLGGGVLVGVSLAVLGPLPAFAVGELVLAGLGPQPLVVLVVLQLALVALLVQPTLATPAPLSLVAAGAVTLGTAGSVTAAVWLWTGSAAIAALSALGALGSLLYVVDRYERVVLELAGT